MLSLIYGGVGKLPIKVPCSGSVYLTSPYDMAFTSRGLIKLPLTSSLLLPTPYSLAALVQSFPYLDSRQLRLCLKGSSPALTTLK